MQENRFWAMLADVPLWLETRWEYTPWLFRTYTIEPGEEQRQQYRALARDAGLDPEQPLRVTAAEIEYERSVQPPEAASFPAYVIESLAVYRKIMDVMQYRDAIMFHSSALELDGKAYLFTAPSGTGKSTHTRLWRETFGDRVQMINDDKPLLRLQADGSWKAYGTPYGGKENIQNNISQTIGGIALLERGTENEIERLGAKEAYLCLLIQTYRNDQKPQALLHIMDLVGSLANLPVFRLQCNISQQAVQVAYEALKGETK